MSRSKLNILILYGHLEYPLRAAVRDLVYSFKAHATGRCFHYSPDHGEFPHYLKNQNFDLIVFTSVFISERWGGGEQLRKRSLSKIDHLKTSNAIKIVHPQDEWIHTDVLCQFINEFGIKHVFSVAPKSEWTKIYDNVDHSLVMFHEALTGYLSQRTVQKIDEIVRNNPTRDIGVGYRAFRAPAWLGSHGFLKTKIAEVFKEKAPSAGFTTDISTDKKDTILGDNWFRFMARCKYFIGVEGGSTVLDRDATIWKKGMLYEQENPDATFEEFEKNCFPGMDGNLQLIALSPRHLEACATQTCQVLIEGYYNGVLKPGLHYIELKRDFSNLNEVFLSMKDEEQRKLIAKKAYDDIVASGEYSYAKYVNFVMETSGITVPHDPSPFRSFVNYRLNLLKEFVYWKRKNPDFNNKILRIRKVVIAIYIMSGLRWLKAKLLTRT